MESVNNSLNPLHRLILSYAKKNDRPKFELLFAFDSRLAEIIRSTSEPLIGQMRLTWWRDVLTKLPEDRPDSEPLVSALNKIDQKGSVESHFLTLIDGWEVMLEDFPWDDRQFETYAHRRGTGYFCVTMNQSRLSDNDVNVAKIWALWDFALHCSDPEMRNNAFQRCMNLSEDTEWPSFDRSGRPLSILCQLAKRDVKRGLLSDTMYKPATAVRILWHGITGL